MNFNKNPSPFFSLGSDWSNYQLTGSLIILTFLMGIMIGGVIIIELDFVHGFQKCIIHRVLSGKIPTKNLLELGGHS